MNPKKGKNRQKRFILGVIGADVHVIGSKILQFALEEAGFKVTYLGVANRPEDFIKAATEEDADAILVSSIYGHAQLDCIGFRAMCVEAGLKDILLYIGGRLDLGFSNWEETERKFKEYGFDRIYPSGTHPDNVIRDLKKDLGEI